jgi:hypothetical protein
MVLMPMNANSSETEEDAATDGGDPIYFYKPNLVGSPWVFVLRANGLAWELGRRSGFVRYEQVRRVRLSYRPGTMQSYRFLAEIWSEQGPKLQISSTSFRSMMEQARQDAEYAAFITELHKRLAATGSTAQFLAGMHPIMYWLGAAVFAVIGVVLGGFLVRTLWQGDLTGAAVVAAVIALLVWQVGTIFHRNRPGSYRPDAVPAAVLPRPRRT